MPPARSARRPGRRSSPVATRPGCESRTTSRAIAAATNTAQAGRVDRLAGRLRATLDYGQTDEILADLRGYLVPLLQLCMQLDAAIYQTYIAYPADQSLSA